MRIQSMAIMASQDTVEAYIIYLFEDTVMCAMHAKHVQILTKDIQLTCRIRGKRAWIVLVSFKKCSIAS